ncbi:hypothetical protein [Halobacillus halophilus]|uniref:hypothetical protein n=1 Tax=Halobacillus halophilus TaxID=1570 RepID=UPI001CD4BCAD|nr:hypothetical protein [Halobacillus halophilus]MCA1011745.1 hypothetical protein [Halobacillus halophilus]
MDKVKKIIKKNRDEIGIATALGHFYSQGSQIDIEEHGYTIEALKRSNTELQKDNINELHIYGQLLKKEHLAGLIKGIAHEVYYVEAENEDGNAIYAYMFEDAVHEDYDIVVYDQYRNSESFQMKAQTQWPIASIIMEEVGSDQGILTEELA